MKTRHLAQLLRKVATLLVLCQILLPTQDAEASRRLRYGVVLKHGFNAKLRSDWFYSPAMVKHIIKSLGADRATLVEVPPYASSEVRAQSAMEQIDRFMRQTGVDKVHLISHSQGGKDDLVITSPKGLAAGDRIVSATSIQTPHMGTQISNVLLKIFSQDRNGLPVPKNGIRKKVLAAVTRLMALALNERSPVLPASMLAAHETMRESTASSRNTFNEEYPLDPRVVYLSWAGLSNFHRIPGPHDRKVANTSRDGAPLLNEAWATPFRWFNIRHSKSLPLKFIAPIVSHGLRLIPNDGVVPTESAKGPEGFIFRGTIPTDHMGPMGQGRNAGHDRWTGFDPMRFIDTLIADLELVEKGGPGAVIEEGRAWHDHN